MPFSLCDTQKCFYFSETVRCLLPRGSRSSASPLLPTARNAGLDRHSASRALRLPRIDDPALEEDGAGGVVHHVEQEWVIDGERDTGRLQRS